MITFLSRKIADFLFRRNVISEEYVEICQYGYEVMFLIYQLLILELLTAMQLTFASLPVADID